MTTYNTYQEAKIANPECNIYKLETGKFATENWIEKSNFGEYTFNLCNPAGHCMTVEKFLADGYKFVGGDIIIDSHRSTKMIDEGAIIAMNMPAYCDKSTYILRAAALEEKVETESEYDKGMREAMKKIAVSCGRVFGADVGYEDLPDLVDSLINPPEKKPRTKVEYVKLNVNDEGGKFWEVARDWSEGKCDFRFMRGNGYYELIDSNEELLKLYTNRKLYRRIEIEIDERQEFIDAYRDLREKFVTQHEYEDFDGFMADSGKFKLVN